MDDQALLDANNENLQAEREQRDLDYVDRIEDYESFNEQNNLKKTISRSFSRKLNLGNYETADFFCAYSQEVVGATPLIEIKEISHSLYIEAKHDVLRAIESFKTTEKHNIAELYQQVRDAKPIPVEIWQELSSTEQNLLHKAQLLRAQETRNNTKQKNATMSHTSNRAS